MKRRRFSYINPIILQTLVHCKAIKLQNNSRFVDLIFVAVQFMYHVYTFLHTSSLHVFSKDLNLTTYHNIVYAFYSLLPLLFNANSNISTRIS